MNYLKLGLALLSLTLMTQLKVNAQSSSPLQNLLDPSHLQYDYHKTTKYGQTFNTGDNSGELESITIKVSYEGRLQGGKLAIDLYEIKGSTLSYIASSENLGYFKGVTNTRKFAPGIRLESNKNYAFLIRSANFFGVAGSAKNPYEKGDAFISSIKSIDPNEVNYTALADFDLYFDIKVKEETAGPKTPQTEITCDGKEYVLDSNKDVWEKRNGIWVQIGENCKDLVCAGGRVFNYMTDGMVMRYNGTPKNWTPANTLEAGQFLEGTENAHFLVANNQKYFLYMQDNGDIEIWFHNPESSLFWSSKTAAGAGCKLRMQKDGNLVAYKKNGTPIWSSGTHESTDTRYNQAKYKPVKAVLENDGKLVLYSATGYRVWTSADGQLPLN